MTTDLDRNQVHIWYCWCDQVASADLRQHYLAVLSADERERYDRFVFDKDRHQFLVARVLLRTSLSRYAAVAPDAWEFSQPPGKKPVLANPANVPPLEFNLSNSIQLAACAVTVGDEVGIDVESAERSVDLRIARNYFSAPEVVLFEDAVEEDKLDLFIRLWTLKEAYVKARGLGLSLPLKHFSFAFPPNLPPAISFDACLDDDPDQWQFFQRLVLPRHYLAVAVRRPIQPRCRFEIAEVLPLVDSSPGE